MKPNGVLEVDVLVFGGGPAGAATALALGRRGLSAALVDRSDSTKDRIGETLPPAIRPLLSKLGVWERFSRDGHMASGGVHSSWGRADLHINDFIVNPHGLGWHVDRALFDSMLAREAERIGAVVLRKSTIRPDIARTPCGWECQLTVGGNTQTIRAQFVVDATGRSSGFARGQGAQRLAGDHLIGIIGFLSSCSKGISHDSFTFVESVENGWWYSAPLPNGRAVAAYMTDADLFAGEAGRRSSFWSKQLNRTKHIRTRLKDFRLSSPPLVRCANSAKLARPAGFDGSRSVMRRCLLIRFPRKEFIRRWKAPSVRRICSAQTDWRAHPPSATMKIGSTDNTSSMGRPLRSTTRSKCAGPIPRFGNVGTTEGGVNCDSPPLSLGRSVGVLSHRPGGQENEKGDLGCCACETNRTCRVVRHG